MTSRTASCLCGRLTATADGDPARISVCHCLNCKQRSGSAFAWTATFDADKVSVSGACQTYERRSDEGNWARFHFCAACGGTVFYEIQVRPGMISIPAGGFADPAFPPPTIEVYEERRCLWLPDLGIPREY